MENSIITEGTKISRKKIIIVDDNASYLSIVRTLLKPFYDTYPALSGKKLFDIMKKFIPDVVLLDISMPEMDGYEVIKKMKESPRYKDIPVMFITSKDDEDSAVTGLNLGAIDYVTKPFYGPLLLRRIGNLLTTEQLKRDLQESQAALNDTRLKLERFEKNSEQTE